MLTKLAIAGYRSIRELCIELEQVNIITGANGSGKSSLYRALRLLADVANGRIIQSLAQEGGLSSTLWAGPETISRAMKSGEHPIQGGRRSNPVSLKLGFSGEDYGYAIDVGLPPPKPPSMFFKDPQIKSESLWAGQTIGQHNEIASRKGPGVRVKNREGEWKQASVNISPADSMMALSSDPYDGIELLILRETMRNWRFYDHLRTDREAPARFPQVGTFTPMLASDGSDFCAALQTIFEIGDENAVHSTIEDAFPKSRINIVDNNGYFELEMKQYGLLRPLKSAELSDGTLRYLLLTAALHSPRPPRLMILNEPETSLHPELIAPLGRMIAAASNRCQIIVVTHSDLLADAIGEKAACKKLALVKEFGETRIIDNDEPIWKWPAR